jgi:hypothetical protein
MDAPFFIGQPRNSITGSGPGLTRKEQENTTCILSAIPGYEPSGLAGLFTCFPQ